MTPPRLFPPIPLPALLQAHQHLLQAYALLSGLAVMHPALTPSQRDQVREIGHQTGNVVLMLGLWRRGVRGGTSG